MKIQVGIVTAFIVCIAGVSQPVRAIDALMPPPRLSTSPLIISAYYISGATPGYFEIYNSGSEVLNLKEWSLSLKWSLIQNAPQGSIIAPPLQLPFATTNSYLPSHQYAVVNFGSIVTGASINVEALSGQANNFVSEIAVLHPNFKVYSKSFTSPQSQRMMLGETSTGYTTTGTYSVDTRASVYDNGLFAPTAIDFPIAPIEVLANPRNCAPTEADTTCREYIKFFNTTTEPISFEGTRLRIGYQGQVASSTNTVVLGGIIQPGEYAVFDRTEAGAPLSITNSGAYIWLEDLYGTTVYPSTIVSYPDASSDSHKGTSWASMDGVWQWASPSPSGSNTPLPEEAVLPVASVLAPCRADQYRNPETNRCKALDTVSEPTACDAGEYRNPDTGRCKKMASNASSSLQPCDEGQYRNPDTNRCKSIVSQTANVTPCQAGWERNPETNRCRKSTSGTMPRSDFAVEPYDTPASNSLGWVAFATVGTGLAAYGIWEWRSELLSVRRRLHARFMR